MAADLDLMAPVQDCVDDVFKQRLADRSQRAKTVQAMMQWLQVKARKKPVPDLAERLDRMEAAVTKLVDHMAIKFEDGKIVVKPAGSDEMTWNMFRLGTDWFDPNPDLTETVLSGLFNE